MIKSGRAFIRMTLDEIIGTPCEREILEHEKRNAGILEAYQSWYLRGDFDNGYDGFVDRHMGAR